MQVVILRDMMGGYATTWTNIANTAGVKEIRIGDEFREEGTGEAGEQFKVEALDISPVAGSSRLFLLRGHHTTTPQSHRAGCVLEHLNARVPVMVFEQHNAAASSPVDLLADLDEPAAQPVAQLVARFGPPRRKRA